ncbi:MAG: hypothetical protein CMB75_02215 [Euryarchaeota archaeon]|nr:hypothetical protein [Euryarchaeota archaeon]|tara:strand:+ start:5997 stop:7628 length:1632 start_codon:yes stop_codon:yes gene_type:complete
MSRKDQIDSEGRRLATTVWTALDRKAGAIIELTVRQLKNKTSTWTVMGVSVLLLTLLSAFYIDAVRQGFESIDNDGDSVDFDGDGYPLGQEMKYGSSDYDDREFPGAAIFIPEDQINYWGVRTHSGNYTWDVFGPSKFTGNWENAAYNFDGSNDECPEIIGENLENTPYGYSSFACTLADNSLYVQFLRFDGNGTLAVAEGWNAEYGRTTESYYVPPDPPSAYIDEDGLDWDSEDPSQSQGFDDDGDCTQENYYLPTGNQNNDENRNGIACDVQWIRGPDGSVLQINKDEFVDEDPVDSELLGESSHRSFIIATGKIAFAMIIGIFLPLFLALGLIRDESENGTLHYLLSKPIHRGEFIVYRLTGYLIFTGGFVLAMSLIMALITVTIGPDGNRLGDINVWFGIGIVTVLSLAAYGSIFNAMGLISPKYGVYFALVYGVYEFAMAVMTLFGADLVPIISVSHWSLQMIDAIVILAWPDTIMLAQMATAFNLESGLAFFWNPPVHTFGTGSSALALSLSVIVLLVFITFPILIGQSIFNRREID